MSETTVDVGFGMKCLSAALNAKSGVLERASADELLDAARDLKPVDPAAIVAVACFRDRIESDPAAAGDALLRYLAPMRAGFDWQDRADLK